MYRVIYTIETSYVFKTFVEKKIEKMSRDDVKWFVTKRILLF